MEHSLPQMLECPVCHGSLQFEGTKSKDRLVEGFLFCPNGHLCQVKDEIPLIKDPKLSRDEFVWKVEFPNLQRYEEIQRQYGSYLSEELKEADNALLNEPTEGISDEKIVLDIASGMGRLLLVLSQCLGEGTTILGIDVDEKPLRGAKLKLQKQNSYDRISLCVMDGKHLAIQPQKIPCATSFFGLDNIPNTEKAFEELHRTITPNGRLTLATLWLKEKSRSITLAEKYGYGAIATEERLIQTLEQTGFKVISVQTFYSGKWPHNPMDLIPVEDDWFAHSLILALKP